ncbi:MAG: hypothetical protein R3313_01495 [Candidatus Saccharimonadales bacterium]|nr:hypothetical protein [Candidatus Saccharimonadales bacterium]
MGEMNYNSLPADGDASIRRLMATGEFKDEKEALGWLDMIDAYPASVDPADELMEYGDFATIQEARDYIVLEAPEEPTA